MSSARFRTSGITLAGLSLLTLLSACSSILGIEEHVLITDDSGSQPSDAGPDAVIIADDSGPRASEQQCEDYCDTVGKGCTESAGLSAYALPQYCEATCRLFPSKAGQLTGNTVECRTDQARKAFSVVGGREGAENCQRAAPGGASVCGTNCENYCQLWASACTGQDAGIADSECLEKCGKLRSADGIDQVAAFASAEDTVECRLAHLSAAAFQPDPHCEHSSLAPGVGPCNPREPKCLDYCTVLMNTCSSPEFKQYDTLPECLAMCERGLDKVSPDPSALRETEDSVSCRKYHAVNALILGNLDHCHHAGPGGDGHCGTSCAAYCNLAKKTCGAEFDKTYPSAAACETACATLVGQADPKKQGDYKYNLSAEKREQPLNCRIYHAVKALTTPAECAAALGAAPCK